MAADLDKALEWKLDESRNDLNLENWFTRLRYVTTQIPLNLGIAFKTSTVGK